MVQPMGFFITGNRYLRYKRLLVWNPLLHPTGNPLLVRTNNNINYQKTYLAKRRSSFSLIRAPHYESPESIRASRFYYSDKVSECQQKAVGECFCLELIKLYLLTNIQRLFICLN